MNDRAATSRTANGILRAAAAIVMVASAPATARAETTLPEDVHCIEVEVEAPTQAPALALPQPDLGARDLRLRALDFLPPTPESHPGRMVGFASAMLGVQVAALALAPPSNWNGRVTPSFTQFRSSFTTPPVWSTGDPWTTSYIAHPIMGSLLYTAARRSNYGPVGSFLFATAGSTLWEYGVEGWFEQPSWPDLLMISTSGALIGELRWRARQSLLRRGRPGFWGQMGLAVADPIAEVQLLVQTIAGRKAARDLFGDELL
ncbi:MAG: DUF3943 domain-containing protein [Anaeromyxobacteraceae bacterium]